MTRKPSDARRSGTTLVEVLVGSALVGVMIVASLESVRNASYTRRLNASRMVGPALAEDLLGEVLATPYEDPEGGGGALGVESGELSATRADFDDVDDFHGWDSADAEVKAGDAIADYSGWRRQVNVRWADPTDLDATPVSDSGLKLVSVTVTSPEGVVTEFEALRWRGGALEQTPEADMTAVTWVGAELRVGASPVAIRRATPLTNHASDAY